MQGESDRDESEKGKEDSEESTRTKSKFEGDTSSVGPNSRKRQRVAERAPAVSTDYADVDETSKPAAKLDEFGTSAGTFQNIGELQSHSLPAT